MLALVKKMVILWHFIQLLKKNFGNKKIYISFWVILTPISPYKSRKQQMDFFHIFLTNGMASSLLAISLVKKKEQGKKKKEYIF